MVQVTSRYDNTSDERARALVALFRQGNVSWDSWHPPMITPIDEGLLLMDILGIDAEWFSTLDEKPKRDVRAPKRRTDPLGSMFREMRNDDL